MNRSDDNRSRVSRSRCVRNLRHRNRPRLNDNRQVVADKDRDKAGEREKRVKDKIVKRES